MRKLSGLIFILAVIAAGCGGGGMSTSPGSQGQSIAQGTFKMLIPNRATTSSASRPQFVSPSVVSGRLAAQGIPDQILDLSATSKSCTTASGGRVCTVGIAAPVGNPQLTLTLYDAVNATGNVLGSTTGTVPISSTGFTVSFTVDGVVASFVVNIVFAQGNPTNAFIVGQTNSAGITVTAKDADGNVIVSPGGYTQPITITNSDTTGAFTISGGSTVSGPNSGPLLNYNGHAVSGPVTIGGTATGVTTITPAIIFGGPTSSPSSSPSASPTPTASAGPTSVPVPGLNCSAPALGPGTYTSIFSDGTTTGNIYTASTSASASGWVSLIYSGSATPTPAPSGTGGGGGGGTQAVNAYFGQYSLIMGTQGCAVFFTTTDGSPLGILSPATFNGVAVGLPVNVSAPVTGVAGSGTITALTITLSGNSGSGTVSLSNGDSGTITVGNKFTVNIPANSGTASPSATPGPVVLMPNFLTFTAPNQFQTVAATQAGNGSSTFTFTPITCPGPGSGAISQPGPGVFSVESLTTSSGQTCTTKITGLGGIQATLGMTF